MTTLDAALHSEVWDYLNENCATKAERATVWQMVHEGFDHLSNPWGYAFDGGILMDLVAALRFDDDLQEWYDSMTPEERAAEFGPHYGPPTREEWEFQREFA